MVASATIVASPLPVPPLVVPRSYSIPSRGMGQRHLPETNQNRVVSPPSLPLTPASLMNLRSLSRSRVGEVAHSGQIRGNEHFFCNLDTAKNFIIMTPGFETRVVYVERRGKTDRTMKLV